MKVQIKAIAQESELAKAIDHKINNKTKPLGSLGALECVAKKIALIQNSLSPTFQNPTLLIFAGDHGAAIQKSGISPFPSEVTYQMVLNFLRGGAAINVFSEQNQLGLKVIDAGVNFDFSPMALEKENPCFINAKIAKGTKNYLHEDAMSAQELEKALTHGAIIVDTQGDSNVIGFGEMGIGNSSSASLIFSTLADLSLEECVGAGAGHTSEGITKKIEILKQVKSRYTSPAALSSPEKVMCAFGGFEIAMMAGAMLRTAEVGKTILVDGFITSAAILWASKISPHVLDYAIFTHQSNERAHALMLEHLKAKPLLNLNLRLGEGSGVAVSYPIVLASINFLNKMASFSEAQVSKKV
ncbi:MAG: nicotinate-nucleotide--dimethylbenzimidazole phosphoribosyltransferase [Oligoflexia bacterium]|nr:nicotinate-nucleotide--dimethylbenzimidazole phosphoribosyltransferase [Oligoflexia bacterium]